MKREIDCEILAKLEELQADISIAFFSYGSSMEELQEAIMALETFIDTLKPV